MAAPGKVIHIDFQKGRKTPAGFGGGPRFVAAVMVFTLAAVVAAAAVAAPSWITSAFFGPLAVMIAVLTALAARRLLARLQVGRMSREREGSDSRTLH